MLQILPGTKIGELQAGRIVMRRFTRCDLDRRCEWPSYDNVVFHHLNLALNTQDQRDRWYRREESVRRPFWFAVDDENGKLIGSITLREVSRWKRLARLGIHMHPKRLGMGYGTEAMRLFMKYYFILLKYRLLKLDVAAYNARAIRCYEKLGFRRIHDFWRPNLTSVYWLKDERFRSVREFVKLERGLERIKHIEMRMSAAEYAASLAEITADKSEVNDGGAVEGRNRRDT